MLERSLDLTGRISHVELEMGVAVRVFAKLPLQLRVVVTKRLLLRQGYLLKVKTLNVVVTRVGIERCPFALYVMTLCPGIF